MYEENQNEIYLKIILSVTQALPTRRTSRSSEIPLNKWNFNVTIVYYV